MQDDDLLRRSQELQDKLFRNSPAAVALVRLGGGILLDCNDAYERMFGWRREEAIGRSSVELRIWANAEDRDRFLERIARERRVTDFRSRARRKNGEEFDSLLSCEVIEERGEKLLLVMVLDVSEGRRADETRALLAAVFETSSDAIILSNPRMEIVSWNAAAGRMFGWAAAEAVGRELALLVPPERMHEMQRNTELMKQGATPAPFETVRLAKDGRRLDVQIGLSGVYDGEGRLTLVAGTFRDVTERKRAERALRESEQRFRVLSELSADFYWEQDEQLRFVERVGHTWERHSYPAADVIGKTRWELSALNLGEEDWQRHRADLEARREFRNLEIERPLPSGGTRWISTSGRPIFDAEGRFRGYRGVGSDITERKRAERALRESEQRFRALVDLSSDWYWATDAEHRFTFREGEILRRMGIPPEADYGMRRWEIGFLNMDERAWADHRALLERREEFRDLLLERRSPDGRLHWATISGRPQYDAEGNFVGYHGTGRDVTRQALAEQHLRQLNEALEQKVAARTADLDAANRELEAFSYSVSHDLRAPLRQIDGFLRLLSREIPQPGEKAAHYLGTITSAAQRMSQLIEDLLAFSRIGRSELKKRAVDLSALARQVAKELAAGAPERRVAWRIAEGLAAHADPGLMRVVLENLLGNAWKYTRRKPQATIEFARTPAGEFMVRDDGAGFDPKFAKSLFQPFRRLHAAQEFEGSGVGLATIRRILERHGGSVRAEGAVDAGATIRFTLPPA